MSLTCMGRTLFSKGYTVLQCCRTHFFVDSGKSEAFAVLQQSEDFVFLFGCIDVIEIDRVILLVSKIRLYVKYVKDKLFIRNNIAK